MTVTDDDERGVIVSAVTVTVRELPAAGTTYSVILGSQPTSTVTVTPSAPSAPPGAALTFQPSSLQFTTANWDQPQTVTVTAADDDLVEEDAVVEIAHVVRGGDYGSVTAALVTATVLGFEEQADGTVELKVPMSGDMTVTVPEGTSVPAGTRVTLPSSASGATLEIKAVEEGEHQTALADPPQGFRAGDTVLDIELSTGQLNGEAVVCLPGTGGQRVHRYDDSLDPPEWVELDPPPGGSPPGLACGVTDSFSLFALGRSLVEMAVRPWLSRFARTVASHVVDAISDRLAKPPKGSQVTLGGQRVNVAETRDGVALKQALTAVARSLGAPGGPPAGGDDLDGFPGSGPGQAWAGHGSGSGPDGRRGAGSGHGGFPAGAGTENRQPSGRELLRGSSFHLAKEDDESGLGLTAWGRVSVGGFDGEEPAEDGNVRIDGDVTTGIIGADVQRNRVLAGVAISISDGEGTFEQPGEDSGKIRIESKMTAVSPYARYMVNDRLSVWGLAGLGTGDMTIVQEANDNEAERTRTDIGMRLAAIGGRGALMEAGESGGIDLALKADAFHVRTEADPIADEGKTTAAASRVRLALEGSREFRREDGGTVTPGLELGLRRDGGDAETGTGVEFGSLVSYEDPETGLTVEARVRALVAHSASNYREWGASGSVGFSPGERGRGLSFSLAPTWGAASSGMERLWSARNARGLAPEREFEAEQRLEGEIGYGFGLFGDRFTGTPNAGFGASDDGGRDYRIGWRLTPAVRGYPGFQVNLDATRRESANDNGNEPPAHGVLLRGAMRW